MNFNTEKHVVSMPKGTISAAGIEAIQSVLCEELLDTLPDNWEWKATVGGKGEYVGTFPKRLSKYYYQKSKKKLDSDFLGKIGSLVSQYSAKQTDYLIDYTQSFDWRSGDFGDDGSCFWGCRSGARVALQNSGAYAVRFYSGEEVDNGEGRAWLAKYKNGWVCFNGYGLETAHIAQVVSTDLGLPYKRIKLVNNGDDCGVLWINSRMGYYIGNDAIQYDDLLDLRIECCNHCECGSESEVEINGTHYCMNCAYETFFYCEDCGGWCDNDFCNRVGDRSVCDDCLTNYTFCQHCEEYYPSDDVTEIDGKDYCDDCRDRLFTKCNDCGDYAEETTSVDGGEVCDDCLDNYNLCETCDEYFRKTLTVDGVPICQDCFDADTRSVCGCETREYTNSNGKLFCPNCLKNYEYSEELGAHILKGQLCLV